MKPELIYGAHAVALFVARLPERVLTLLTQSGRGGAQHEPLLAEARRLGVSVQTVPRKTLDSLVDGGNHQGLVARIRPRAPLGEDGLAALLEGLGEPAMLLVLDGVQDPHNLGACLRTADGAGVHAVIAPRNRAVGLTPAVRKVASGATEFVPFVQVTNLARTLRTLTERGIRVVGTAQEGGADLYATALTGPLALAMGGEGKGLRRLTREHCDELVRLPMLGGMPSLNVSVATGVTLYEALRQRRVAPAASRK